MTQIAVDMAPVWTGLGFLAVMGRRRRLPGAPAAAAAGGAARPERAIAGTGELAGRHSRQRRGTGPESVPTLAPVLQFSAAQRHWADRLRRDRAVTSQDRDARTVAHSAGA